jgi:AraC-like DNA-binding protein
MQSEQASQIRAAVLTGFAELARKLGHDPVGLLKSAGLDTRVLIEPDMPIGADKVCKVLELAAIETNSEDFGLRLAQMHGIGTLGPIGMLAREQSSVGEAMRTLGDYLYLHNSAAHLTLRTEGDTLEIVISLNAPRGIPMRQANELMMAATVGVMRSFLGAQWNPLGVCFPHAAPGRREAHRRLFRCSIEFEQPMLSLIVSSADMRRPVDSSNPEFQRYARQWVDALAAQANSDQSLAESARRLIPLLLSSGNCTAERLAGYFRLNRRTVHSKLRQSGTSFSELVNGVRRELAESSVRESRRSLRDISDMLGFSHLSGFSRWFTAEFGASPSQWRNDQSSKN